MISTPTSSRIATRRRRGQSGVALIVVLILLLIMTLLGLASLRGTLLEERMAANLFDRSLGFQAAEAALRQGEVVAMGLASPPAGNACAAGVCGPPLNGLNRALGNADWVNATELDDNTLAVPNAADLQYIVEYLGEYNTTPKCDLITGPNGRPKDPLCKAYMYRVSSRYVAQGRSSVILQSIVRRPSP
ncbi:pilus assembly PilX family protein [Marilutibacter aestuarii]|uniref:Pilus assembly protein n=1 Tax=Marilutibacter aestuarii TaxID=1706195 RepID=A0A508AN20_9GAMM|nr:PilX N-terminal domain-containing pilus assembly protein [Lysobacter aestuarii]TQD51550.1 pilus assembly protein [Lysobacter aestuarii]